MTQASASEPTPSRRRWFHFSLRSLLIFMTLVGAGLGWVGKERMQSWREGQFAKDHPEWDTLWWPPPDPKRRERRWHRLADFVLGPRIFQIVTWDPQLSDLTPIAGLQNLQELWLDSNQVTDEQVKWLQEKLPNCMIDR